MHHLLCRKIVLLVTSFFFCTTALIAQLRDDINQDGHDDKPYHFGINLGYNASHFSFNENNKFLQNDSVLDVESITNAGINLAWLVNLRLSNHFDIRMHPLDLTFSQAGFVYTQKYPTVSVVTKNVQSIKMSFPFQLAFISDRIGNFKAYTILGGKIDYDLASTASARKAEDLIKLKPYDFSMELGMGCHLYFSYFVLSPEIKISSGLVNLHSPNPNLLYSNVIDNIYSKMVTFSLTVE